MPISQKRPIGNTPEPSVIQDNFAELFFAAHLHSIRDSFPTSREGSSQDIVIVDDGTDVYICVKTARGWFKTSALAAV